MEKMAKKTKTRLLPKIPRILTMLGPAFVWAAIAQGSGELIWWPYFAAKYGTAFLGLLLPASLIQFFVNREVSRYTALTGQGIWHGFLSLGKYFALPLFSLCFLSFLWLGGYASAGGTALFELTHFPSGVSARIGTLFWAYLLIAAFSLVFIFSKVVYQTIEKFMKLVSVVTVLGLLFSVTNPVVVKVIPEFLESFLNPLTIRWPENWDFADSSHLTTAIAFAGMGGFLNLLYSYWMKDKGVGMAKYTPKISGLLVKSNSSDETSKTLRFSDSSINEKRWKKWMGYLNFDAFLAVLINAFTAAMTTLLALAILRPQGKYPTGWKIAVVQAEFFRTSFGKIGVLVFLAIAAFFMIDTWLGLVDGVARQFADFFYQVKKKKTFRFWYYLWLGFLVLASLITIALAQPGILITIIGVISIFAFVFYIPALWYLNHVKLPKEYPAFTKPKKWETFTLGFTWLFYLVTAVGYLLVSSNIF